MASAEGWQQLSKLVRKNLLLKSRRPKATCFELALPIVLFALLVYIRQKYDKTIAYFGPYEYEHTSIFPVSRIFSDSILGERRLQEDAFDAGEYGNYRRGRATANIGGELFGQFFCGDSLAVPLGRMLEPLLRAHTDINGTSLASQLRRQKASDVADWAERTLEGWQTWNVTAAMNEFSKARAAYLGSAWPAFLENAAVEGDELLRELREDGVDDARVRQIHLDNCNMRGGIYEGMSSAQFARELVRISEGMEAIGLTDIIDNEGPLTALGLLALLIEVEAEEAADGVEESSLWLSHFIHADSLFADLLGGAMIERKGISRGYETWIGSVALEGAQRMQRAYEGSTSAELALDMMGYLSPLLDLHGDFRDVEAAIIEAEVLPKWQADWREQCMKLDANKVVSEFRKTQRGCPFYKKVVRSSDTWTLTTQLAEAHANLENISISGTSRELEKWQRALREVSAGGARRLAKKIVSAAQEDDEAMFNIFKQETQDFVPKMSLRIARVVLEEIAKSTGKTCKDARREKGSWDNPGNFIEREFLRRKLLVAPYAGEAKSLWDLIAVELTTSLTINEPSVDDDSILWTVLQNPLMRAFVAKLLHGFMADRTITFKTERELEAYAIEHPTEVLGAIVFRSADETTGNFPAEGLDVQYAIRMHAQLLPSTQKIVGKSEFMKAENTGVRYPYIDVGVAFLQDLVGRASARLRAQRGHAGPDAVEINAAANDRTSALRRVAVSIGQYPVPRFRRDTFVYAIQYTLPMCMVLGWIYAVSLLAKEIVYEKQERLRELMRVMGLRTWVYWASWCASATAQLAFLVIIITNMMSLGGVLRYSNSFLIFLFFMLYSVAVVSLATFISACFSRAKVAAVCAGIIYWSMYLPFPLYERYADTMSIAGKCMYCLLCPTALCIGMSDVAKLELMQEGLQWSNVARPPPLTTSGALPKDSFSVASVMGMLVFDIFFYQAMAWYIEKVFPGDLGLPQPWYFPLLPSYWRVQAVEDASVQLDTEAEQHGNKELRCWEAPSSDLEPLVKIRGLVKNYRGGKKALKGISLDMHRGTILGLLGHNGAGKSTTMAILTGLFPPTEGDVQVLGRSVRKDSHGVRKLLGICPQENALWGMLTVQEHLVLFCSLKGVPSSRVQADVAALLRDTGLVPKANAAAESLSGGMKRKLSIGIALAGGSQVIALDEPTAGVDAGSRREIWHMLAAHKVHRTILLSTHFMDEADVLSDRIAVIAEGHLTAIGSSVELKRFFADAYMLTVVASDTADVGELLAGVRSAIPEARNVGSRGREHSFALPARARQRFAGLFALLQDDKTRAQLGVETYGLSAATMEEVFLQASSVHETGLGGVVRNGLEVDMEPPPMQREYSSSTLPTDAGSVADSAIRLSMAGDDDSIYTVETGKPSAHNPSTPSTPATQLLGKTVGAEADEPWSINCMAAGPSSIEINEVERATRSTFNDEPLEAKTGSSRLEGFLLLLQQFRARLALRALSARRDGRAIASQLLLPITFVLMALLLARMLQANLELPPLALSTDMLQDAVMDKHLMPLSVSVDSSLSASMALAVQASIRSGDTMPRQLASGAPRAAFDWMRRRLLDGSRELLVESFGAVSIDAWGSDASMTMWFQNKAFHAVPAMLQLCNDARARLVGFDDLRTQAWNHPLPKTRQLVEEETTGNSQIMRDLSVAITMILAMGFIPASFVVYLVQERATNGKHQQLLTGVSSTMYWLSTYVWDMINFTIPAMACFMMFLCFQLEAYSGDNSLAIVLLLMSYGACMTPMMYCLECLFTVPSTAYVTMICTNIFTGTVSVMATSIMDMLDPKDFPDVTTYNEFCKWIFPWLLPNYNLGHGLLQLAANHYMGVASAEFGICSSCQKDPLSYKVAGKPIRHLVIMTFVWLALRLVIEWRFLGRALRMCIPTGTARKSADQDAEVLLEATRVARNDAGDRLVISDLTKSFLRWSPSCQRGGAKTVHSVRGISLGVAHGECFGLLGVNGAGKTTTMRMITGDIEPDGGDVRIGGWSIRSARNRARRLLGYCPQFDALPDKLTVRETLKLYARIRGIETSRISSEVDFMIERMCLDSHQHRRCQHLSGGNKRKLSTALALIGEPAVVLLDEPSTGIDVGARRFLWDVLGSLRQKGHALVLTSHSMDECEVLCTRLTIMVHGEFRCLGTPLQLKDRFGGGYTLTVKARSSSQGLEPRDHIRAFVASELPLAMLAEENVGLFRYRLGGAQLTGSSRNGRSDMINLAGIFQAFEEAKLPGGRLDGCISDYNVSQTSLEEVFLHFTREAEAAPGDSYAKAANIDLTREAESANGASSAAAARSTTRMAF